MTTSDIIIIGSGPGGYETAAEAAALGKEVVLIERDELGGTCLNRGCIPTKALCRSAEIARLVKEGAPFGVEAEGVKLSWPAAMKRKDEVVGQLRQGVATLLSKVNVVKGTARLSSPSTVEVNGEEYTAPQIIIATGSHPASLPIPGAELAISSDELLSLEALPQSIVIIGGGVIGMEFASILNAFGVEVTVVEYCKEILPPFDAEIAKRLRMAMKKRGVNIITGAAVTAINRLENDHLQVVYDSKGKVKEVEAQMVLMAVGRRPVVPEGSAEAGIELQRGAIVVDDKMATSVPGIFAIGDVNARCMLAHAATAQGKVTLGLDQPLEPVPSAVFTEPECAMVGLTEEQCADRQVKIAKTMFRANGKALAMGETDGLAKVIADAESGRLLGAHICGPHAADLVQELATAIAAGLTASEVARAIHGHPTLGETVAAACAALL
ncbi:MAG: dihydrolipoyl dehydrogenase [Bacteroidales bacterium]|nr:dihydrolipoyl dehydrogenase [Bacteroidales bacterium]